MIAITMQHQLAILDGPEGLTSITPGTRETNDFANTPLNTLLMRDCRRSTSLFKLHSTSDGFPFSSDATLNAEEQVGHSQKNSE